MKVVRALLAAPVLALTACSATEVRSSNPWIERDAYDSFSTMCAFDPWKKQQGLGFSYQTCDCAYYEILAERIPSEILLILNEATKANAWPPSWMRILKDCAEGPAS